MPVEYYSLGGHKRLNEIVVAGSHDAGITSGGGYAKTQDLDIGAQAAAGVRVFDLRIAAMAVDTPKGQPKQVDFRAYHGGLKDVKGHERQVANLFKSDGSLATATVTRSKGSSGTAFGEGLVDMLLQAKAFVESPAGGTEFLILKFDKCKNWALIGQACRDILGDAIYKGGGNLNNRTLDQLQGKVVTVFPKSGLAEMGTEYGAPQGMLAFKNLSSKGAGYEPRFHGLQYFGKGGTAVFNEVDKIGQNISNQKQLMKKARNLANPQVVGMIYWTTTGSIWNIKNRNDTMWQGANVARFRGLWNNGLSDYMDTAIPMLLPDGSAAVGPMRKLFMPNIVMIDFADGPKCQVIRDLNDAAPAVWQQMVDD